MIETLYIEENIIDHPRVNKIKKRYPQASIITCKKYTEVFNRNGQNFRLQKIKPALILAEKTNTFVHPIPKAFAVGAEQNFYFSHLLNCPFDCSYCFLQGMYKSANYVLFINFEDYQKEIAETIRKNSGHSCTFFSGYDGDSLALEAVTNFLDEFLPFFEKFPKVELEIRTKSINIRHLLSRKPLENVIVAYTLNPTIIAQTLEKKAPPLTHRLEAIKKLQSHGYKIGLRFDPVIYCQNYQHIYSDFFSEVFQTIDLEKFHSASLGPFRMPKGVEKQMVKIMPNSPLLASVQKESILTFCEQQIKNYIPQEKLFLCYAQS